MSLKKNEGEGEANQSTVIKLTLQKASGMSQIGRSYFVLPELAEA
jgi:hypothetical protein